MPNFLDFIGLFLHIAGFIIGLGAVTVIDLHGFLARKSSYWTEATTRTHKVTKPLIWLGFILTLLGGAIFYRKVSFPGIFVLQPLILLILVLNGIFLSFAVSPYLLSRERIGKASELLPNTWQMKITCSFIVSFLGWWIELALLIYRVLTN